ncbi:MAG: methyltransferase domain-containing protein [Anaerolineales bacterium]|nr:methyltransferase domain-containing protein [Anaerolineales bacterium]
MNPSQSRAERMVAARLRYNRWSRWYDLLASSGERRVQKIGIKQLGVQDGDCIMDLGCGTGSGLEQIAGLAQQCRVIGLDLSGGMLQKANQKRIIAAKKGARISLVQGDLFELPAASQSVSAVLISYTLELFDDEDIPAVLGEVRRILVPAGTIVVVAMAESPRSSLVLRFYRWLHAHVPEWVDCRPMDAAAWIQSAGFSKIQQTRESIFGLPVEIITALQAA